MLINWLGKIENSFEMFTTVTALLQCVFKWRGITVSGSCSSAMQSLRDMQIAVREKGAARGVHRTHAYY
jgi:hypothetical protein